MTIEELVNSYMSNTKNPGNCGRAFESAVRYRILHRVESAHSGNISDLTVKVGNQYVAIECKQGCGWVNVPELETEEEAQEALDNFDMHRAKYVCYIPKFTGDNVDEAYMLTKHAFISILRKYNLLRVKRNGKAGYYGICIQSYIPTPKFKASKERYNSILEDFATHSVTIQEWMTKRGLE